MDVAVIDSMINVFGAPPGPNLQLSAALPTFQPSIGGLITMPADIQLTFRANYFKGGKWLGFDGKTKFKIGKQLIDSKIALTVHLPDKPGAVGYTKIKVSVFEDKPYKNAFGLSWLTIKDYSMLFKAKTDGGAYVEFGGSTIFGSKSVNLAGGFGISAKTAGFPVPSLLEFSIDDGPNKVGSIALRDFLSVYNAMAKATGNPAQVPLDKVPDVAIAGTGKGKDKAPYIKLVFEQSGDDGFEIRGKLRVLKKDIATIEKAFAKMNSGVELKAKMTRLQVGPLVLPHGDIDITMRIDRDTGKIPTPKIHIHTKGLSLFGSKQNLDIDIFKTVAIMKAEQSFGDLFKFKFKAFAGIEGLKDLSGLAKADFRLLASLSSDPGKWDPHHRQKRREQRIRHTRCRLCRRTQVA